MILFLEDVNEILQKNLVAIFLRFFFKSISWNINSIFFSNKITEYCIKRVLVDVFDFKLYWFFENNIFCWNSFLPTRWFFRRTLFFFKCRNFQFLTFNKSVCGRFRNLLWMGDKNCLIKMFHQIGQACDEKCLCIFEFFQQKISVKALYRVIRSSLCKFYDYKIIQW